MGRGLWIGVRLLNGGGGSLRSLSLVQPICLIYFTVQRWEAFGYGAGMAFILLEEFSLYWTPGHRRLSEVKLGVRPLYDQRFEETITNSQDQNKEL